MDLDDVHFEPFLHLAGMDDDQVLIAWGGFWFVPFPDGRGWRIVDDEELHLIDPDRIDSIGQRSQPYGDALVEVLDAHDEVVATAGTDAHNHVWVRGLQPATWYRYRVTVDGRPWATEHLRTWRRIDGERGELVDAQRSYRSTFTTFPEPGEPADLQAVVIGDYGVGIQSTDGLGEGQQRLAGAITRLADQCSVDLVLTVGDNIYHREDEAVGGSGKEDDDWYFSAPDGVRVELPIRITR